ncbi:ATP-dependent zinc protease [Akkermansiaceae bacterium]|nr:ATP-dependent zinc protease [Akkermansiaceae bacterium]
MTLNKTRSLATLLLLSLIALPGLGQETDKDAKPAAEEAGKQEPKGDAEPEDAKAGEDKPEIDPDDEAALEEEEAAAVARPVPAEPVQVYGWREKVTIDGMEKSIYAKLDTGAYTSSIHAEEMELFERDGKKWVRFIVTEPRKKDSPRVRIEAPLVRIARIKNPGGESESREVVKLAFKIGEKKLRGDFTLNNRSNMLSAVLIGRTTIKELGWIDPSRTNLADDEIMR